MHVDLSVAPRRIHRFAQCYPKPFNANAPDIRKRAFADGLLNPGSTYSGPVIAKSDLNYGGVQELNASLLPGRPAPYADGDAGAHH